jgi:centrin-3
MRALGFDMKKADVLKLLREHDKDGRGLMEFDDFQRISKFL